MIFKRQADILTDLIDKTSTETNKLTDFNVGSAVRALYDAFSIEAETLYMLTLENINEGIERGLMSSFDFTPKEATYAYGYLTIELNNASTNDIIIPRGATFSNGDNTSSLKYQTRDNYVVLAGDTSITVEVYANIPGSQGNILARGINTPESNIYNVARVYNSSDILTGNDAETYEQTKQRFQLFIEAIGRATKSAIKYGALTVPEVHSVYVYEQIGLVTVYVADNNGNLSDQVRENVQKVLEDYRPAGIELIVSPMVKLATDVTVDITYENPNLVYGNGEQVEAVIRNYLNTLDADQDLVIAQLTKTIINSDDNIKDIFIAEPAENVIVSPEEIIRAGNITVNIKEA